MESYRGGGGGRSRSEMVGTQTSASILHLLLLGTLLIVAVVTLFWAHAEQYRRNERFQLQGHQLIMRAVEYATWCEKLPAEQEVERYGYICRAVQILEDLSAYKPLVEWEAQTGFPLASLQDRILRHYEQFTKA